MEQVKVRDIGIELVCSGGNGVIVFIDNARYAIHYNVTLAIKRANENVLYLNANRANCLSHTDLKTIRAIDDTFKKKGDKFVSGQYEVQIVEFERIYGSDEVAV